LNSGELTDEILERDLEILLGKVSAKLSMIGFMAEAQ